MSVFRRLCRRSSIPQLGQRASFFHTITERTPHDRDASVSLPQRSRVVVCGGGVVGTSVAYHLAKKGCNEVVLLEQGRLGCGTTWHAAGLIGRLKFSTAASRLCSYSAALYARLEEETGVSTGWKENGSILVARNKERMTLLRRLAGMAKVVNIDAEEISREDCSKLNQLIRTDDLEGGLWIPGDGVADPSGVCQSLAKGATQQGVEIIEKVQVEKVLCRNNQVRAVVTNKGEIQCEHFVNCAGQWGHWLGLTSGERVAVPLHPTEHYYIVTKPIKGISPLFPTVRDPDGLIYGREWSGGLCAGGFEPNAKPCHHNGVPDQFEFQLFPDDWDQFRPLLDEIQHRFPIVGESEIRQMINGPESFTPDGYPILGEAPNVKNYFVATGMNSAGIAHAGGVGMAISEWIMDGQPSFNLWSMDIRRFAPHHNNCDFLRDRVREIVSFHYSIPWPRRQYDTARGIRFSPLAPRLKQLNAVWEDKMGWERVQWFALPEESETCEHDTFSRPAWIKCLHHEMKSCQTAVALFDLTSLAKFELMGSDALQLLQTLCCSDVSKATAGDVVNTLMLNERGGCEVQCDVIRLDDDRYLVMAQSELTTTLNDWMRKHNSSVSHTDVTDQLSVIRLLGPRVTKLLDNSDALMTHFPGLIIVERKDFGVTGVDLILPNNHALHLYDLLVDQGRMHGLVNGGMISLDWLRVENGGCKWGQELDALTTPLEAGLSHLIDWKKDFVGYSALAAQMKNGVKNHVVQLVVQDPTNTVMAWGGEPIVSNGDIIGLTSSAAIHAGSEQVVCLGMISSPLSDQALRDRLVAVQVAGVRYPAAIQ